MQVAQQPSAQVPLIGIRKTVEQVIPPALQHLAQLALHAVGAPNADGELVAVFLHEPVAAYPTGDAHRVQFQDDQVGVPQGVLLGRRFGNQVFAQDAFDFGQESARPLVVRLPRSSSTADH